ncbi:MAG TPA: ABC transporter permease subunit [Anaerolineales bacterium]|nr:ABC transporter permease subunit [Anaerolineales bacterium]
MKPSAPTGWRKILRSVLIGLAVIAGIVIYAYGFQVTKVNLDEARSERRQTQLIRILRALAQPDIVVFSQEQVTLSAPFYMPCPPVPPQQRELNPRQPYMLVTPSCIEPGGKVVVEAFHLDPNADATIFLVPNKDVKLRLSSLSTDASGHLRTEVELPERSSETEQAITVVTEQSVGRPRLSRSAIDTWDKIIETVFLALLATTLGTLIAVPLSFLAARNLMKGITITPLGLALSILAAPIGLTVGAWAASRLAGWTISVSSSPIVSLSGAIVGPGLAWIAARWALPPVEEAPPSPALRWARTGAMLAAAVAAVIGVVCLGQILIQAGGWLESLLPSVSFLGKFVGDLGDIVQILLTAVLGLAAAGLLASLSGKLARSMTEGLPTAALRLSQLVISALAGAVLLALIGAAVDWFYQIKDPKLTLYGPAAVGAILGMATSLRYGKRDAIPIGLAVYYLSRTIFNGLRAIEALIMAVVFVVWVGIGPFAGVLALSLHSIAAMAKLYSEQVESILPGPLEAITATGATRMQTIIYAVIPQIIPPYISFTMYRWDINVRMSTIIGFAGGGGIGFLLFQNINLLNYRAASVQMLAIAIVVASMDYLSSALRERVV